MNQKQIHLEFQNVLLKTMNGFMFILLIGEFFFEEMKCVK